MLNQIMLFDSEKIKKRLMLFLVKRVIGKYINNNIDSSSIIVNLNGFTIKQIELDPYVFNMMDLPFELTSSSIIDLEVFIPWTDLWKDVQSANTRLKISEINLDLKWIYKKEFDDFIDRFNNKTRNKSSFVSYLQQSILDDQNFIFDENVNSEAKEEGIKGLQSMIHSIIKGITVDIGTVKVNLEVNDVVFSLEIYDVHLGNSDQTEGLLSYTDDMQYFRSKQLSFEEFVVSVNRSTLLSIQRTDVSLCMFNTNDTPPITHTHLIVQMGFTYISIDETSINNLFVVISGIYEYVQSLKFKKQKTNQEFKVKFILPKLKFNVVKTNDKTNDNICAVSTNVVYIHETTQKWGSYDHNNTLMGTKAMYDTDMSINLMNHMNNKGHASSHNSDSEKSSNFNFTLENIEIFENETYCILKRKNNDSKNILTVCKSNSNVVLIFIQPTIITIDPNILNRYNGVISAISRQTEHLQAKTSTSVSIFVKHFMVMCYCQLFQIYFKIPISGSSDSVDNTYLETFLIDIISLQISSSTNVSSGLTMSFRQLYVNLVSDKITTTFITVRGDKHSSIKIYTHEMNSVNDVLPEWFKINRINVDHHDIQYLESLNDIESVGKQLIKKTKIIVKTNIYNLNIFISKPTFDIIKNLMSELGQWKSPNQPTVSYYLLSYCKLHSLTYNMYGDEVIDTYRYGLNLENINIFNAMNFYTNTNYLNVDIGNATLTDDLRKRVIIKKWIGNISGQNVLNVSVADSNVTIGINGLKLFIKQDENFWLSDIIKYLKTSEISATCDETRSNLRLYITLDNCLVNYRVANIQTHFEAKITAFKYFKIAPDDLNGISCNNIQLGLIVSSGIEILNIESLAVLWNSSELSIRADKIVAGLCADSFQILNGVIGEMKYHKSDPNDSHGALTEDEEYNVQSDNNLHIQSLIRDAIRSSDTSTNASLYFGTVSIISRKKPIDNLSGKTSPIQTSNGLVKIIGVRQAELHLYAGLDMMRNRNFKNKLTLTVCDLNMIKYDYQSIVTINKNIMTLQQIRLTYTEFLTNTVFLLDNTNFQSATLFEKVEIQAINKYLKRYAKNMLYQNCTTLICNTAMSDMLDFNTEIDLQPIVVNLSQIVIYFIIKYFTYNDKSLCYYYKTDITSEFDMIDSVSKIFINCLKISDVNVTLNYKSSVFDMSYGKTPLILSLMNLNETKLKLNKALFTNISSTELLLDKIENYYISQIKSNNSLNIISSIAPIKTVINIGSGVVNLIIMPCKGIYNSDLKYGIRTGINKFRTQTLAEIANVMFNIVNFADKIVNGTRQEDVIVTIPDNECDGKSIVALVANIAQTGLKRGRDNMYDIKTKLGTP